jgi:peroxiredoxin
LRDEYDKLAAAGIQVVIIGNGSPEEGALFQFSHQLPFKLLVDPQRTAYQAANLPRNISGILNFSTLFGGMKAMLQGYRQGKRQGDPLQQGGSLLIDTNGNIIFAHRNSSPGDEAQTKDILNAIQKSS